MEVSVPSQESERSCVCVSGISIYYVSVPFDYILELFRTCFCFVVHFVLILFNDIHKYICNKKYKYIMKFTSFDQSINRSIFYNLYFVSKTTFCPCCTYIFTCSFISNTCNSKHLYQRYKTLTKFII